MEHTKEKFKHHVGQQIMKYRIRRNLTREQLAEQADISAKYLYEIEMGRKNCSLFIIYRLSCCLEIGMESILQEHND